MPRTPLGHLHYFTKETAIATLADAGFEIADHFYTDDLEISDAMIPKWVKPRVIYELRKLVFRCNRDLAVSLFESFNLMVLARGDVA